MDTVECVVVAQARRVKQPVLGLVAMGVGRLRAPDWHCWCSVCTASQHVWSCGCSMCMCGPVVQRCGRECGGGAYAVLSCRLHIVDVRMLSVVCGADRDVKLGGVHHDMTWRAESRSACRWRTVCVDGVIALLLFVGWYTTRAGMEIVWVGCIH